MPVLKDEKLNIFLKPRSIRTISMKPKKQEIQCQKIEDRKLNQFLPVIFILLPFTN
jgi:hypothetical protein